VARVVTLSKALGAGGGAVCGGPELRSLLLQRGRALVFSSALPHPTVAAARAALGLLRSDDSLLDALRRNARVLQDSLREVAPDAVRDMPIVPVLTGTPGRAVAIGLIDRHVQAAVTNRIPGVRKPATVAELDSATGRPVGSQTVPAHPGALIWRDGIVTSGDHGFGVAEAGGRLWTGIDAQARLGQGLKPFWLQAGAANELLVSAEGSPEDVAPGAVVSIDTMSDQVTTLATPRDPDQVIRSGSDVFVAAHGDRDVLVLRDGKRLTWAPDAEVVALAPDPQLGFLVVVTDADE